MRVRAAFMAAMVGLTFCSASAKADTFSGVADLVGTLTNVQPGGTDTYVTGPSHSNSQVWAGQINWNYASSPSGWMPNFQGGAADSFGTYCTQLNTNVYFNEKVNFKAIDLETLADLTTTGTPADAHQRKLAIEALFGTYQGGIGTDGLKAQAFQSVIWEIIDDLPGHWDLNANPDAYVERFTLNGNAAVLAQAQIYLAGITTNGSVDTGKAGVNLLNVTGLAAYDYYTGQPVQNQSIMAAAPAPADVPLPASAAGGLALLALNGLWYWKRRRG